MKRECKYSGGCLTNLVFFMVMAGFFWASQMSIPLFSDSGVPAYASAEFASILKTVSKEIKQRVLHPQGTEAGKAFAQARAAQQIEQINQLLIAGKQKAIVWAGKNAKKAAADGVALAQRQAIEAGVKRPGEMVQGSFEQIDFRTVGVFARQIAADGAKALDAMGERGKSLIRETAQEGLSQSDISRILANGVIVGKPVETIRRLRDAFEAVHGDRVSFKDKNGDPISFEVGYYAEIVARTQTRMATVAARHERLEELGIDLVMIIGKISKNFCTAFLGQVFSLSGKNDRYPAYDSLPGGGAPFHVQCSKNTRPFVEELASDKQLEGAAILDDSEKLLGMNQTQAQKAYQDLQIHTQIKERYPKSLAA